VATALFESKIKQQNEKEKKDDVERKGIVSVWPDVRS
jgi:hypothetical protein